MSEQHTARPSVSTYIWGGLAAAILAMFWFVLLIEFFPVVLPATLVAILVWRLRLGVKDLRGKSAQRR